MNKEIQIKQECCDIWNNLNKVSFAVEQLEKVKNEITSIFYVPNGIYIQTCIMKYLK